MQIVTGIALLLKFVVEAVVGLRLVRSSSPGWLSPERCLGTFFLVGNVLGGVVITVAYGVWASQGKAASTGVVSQLHAVGQIAICVGYAMVLLFTQRTFHPDSRFARSMAWCSIGLLLASLVGRAIHEGFAISLDPGLFHWTAYAVRMFALVWASWAAFGYWIKARRRAQIGLTDPIVANRFVLWGLWASGNLLTAFSEPIARAVYGWIAGADATAVESIQGVGGPVLTVTLCITSVLAVTTCAILFLAFFPSDGYRQWVSGRAARGSEATV